MAIVGAATAFVAATIACAQQDIKKVLAYSTVSQLGYMFLAVGLGAYEAAIFLMVAHAFFKALLFLGAGSVIHGLARRAGPEAHGQPAPLHDLTFFTFGVGWLAIAGIPPLSGFLAKGDILDNAFAHSRAVGGRPRHRRADRLLHEPARRPRLLRRRPLATGEDPPAGSRPWPASPMPSTASSPTSRRGSWRCRCGAGLLRRRWPDPGHLPLALSLARWAGSTRCSGPLLFNDHQATATLWILAIVDAVVAFVGLAIGLRSVVDAGTERPALEPALLRCAWFVNDIYDAVIGRPAERLAAFCADGGRPEIIDGAVNGAGQSGARRGTPCATSRPDTCATTRSASCSAPSSSSPACFDPAVVDLMTTPFPFLTVLVLLPAVGAAVVAAHPASPTGARRWLHEAVGLAAAVVTLALAVTIAVRFKAGDGGFQLASDHVWAPSLGIRWHLGVDGISLFLVGLTALSSSRWP